MSTPVRRSGRTRTANKKYTNSDWDEEILRQLRASSDSSSNSDESVPEVVDSDKEFHEQPINEVSDQDAVDAGSNTSIHVATTNVFDQPVIIASDAERGTSPKTAQTVKRKGYKKPVDRHSRGLPNIDRKVGKTSIYHDTFGPRVEDLQLIFGARDRWNYKARDVTFPSQTSLEQALNNEWASQPHKNSPPATKTTELTTRQQLKEVSAESIKKRGHLPSGASHGFVLGPWGEQKRFDLPHLATFNFGRAWRVSLDAITMKKSLLEDNQEAHKPSNADSLRFSASELPRISSYHEGWLINVGQKVRCLAWSPSTTSTPQYLAIACNATAGQRQYVTVRDSSRSQAFTPSAGYPSSIQIWVIPSQANRGTIRRSLSFETEPQLFKVFATHYGDIMQLEWTYEPIPATDDFQAQKIQHIVILSTDGCLRVLGIVTDAVDTDHFQAFEIVKPVLCISPPKDLVFTTFALVNEFDIIIGASDGSIRLYNLNRCIRTDSTEAYLQLQLHNTYILKIVPSGTKELPYYIVSTSAAGDLRLTDLRSPYQDFVHVPRTRIPSSNLIYLPQSQSIITAVDHSGRTEVQSARTTIVAHQFRHFYSQLLMMKLPNNTGTASALAGSKLHPYILVGNTQGTVICQNALRRILPRSGGWIQKLCEYEWISQEQQQQHSPKSGTKKEPTFSDLYYGSDVRPGISRFHEGFQLEKQDLATTAPTMVTKKPKPKPASKKRKATQEPLASDGQTETREVENEIEAEAEAGGTTDADKDQSNEVIAEVVFEQEQAVTKIVWNENPPYASWVAIGWGSGIVRIQDLSHDME